jgi:hypothetical protein
MKTIAPLLKGLDKYLESAEDRARRGLQAAAHDVTTALKSTTAHGDVTGATRAGYVAYVVGPDLLSQAAALQALNTSVAAVEARNPGESATAPGSLGSDSLGMVLTSPTTYQQNLETDNAGQRAVLGPTLQAVAADLTRRAAEGR